MTVRFRTIPALLLAAGLLAAGCGEDTTTVAESGIAAGEAPTADGGTDRFPVTVSADNGEITIEAKPTRIISLSPTATEMIFAIGAGGQVTAVDDQSTYPAEAPRSDLSGFTPNVEAVVGMNPDLVVVSDAPEDVLGGLGKAEIPVLVLGAAATLEDTYEQLEVLGDATGQSGGADKVVADMRARIEDITAALPERPKPLTYYHELDDTLYTVTSKTFVGSVYSLVGLINIADAADRDGSGYPQLSVEYLVQADPDLIFLADTKCCAQSAATVAARPGWSGLRAVKNASVVELDDDIASRWGPRIVDQLETVANAVAELPVATS